MDPGLPLSHARLIVATDLDGDAREARIRQAIEIDETALRALFGPRIARRDLCTWDAREGRVTARRQEVLGALVLSDQPWPDPPPDAVAHAALDGLRQIGLPWSDAARRLRARIELARAGGADLPDCTDAALLDRAGDWLLPHLARRRTEAELRALDLTGPLRDALTWDQQQTLDRLCPPGFTTPLGRAVPIDYEGEAPAIELRLQELFGTTAHPTVGPSRTPLRITLLSPGGKPVQVTTDLPGFWATSYADVRKDMRGRYPRHPWPEDPTAAEPTLRAKPRGT
jgi:ATP-dependent helicase HrpB